MTTPLNKDFYLREDVVSISRELIGKFLVTDFNGMVTSGMIVETEAYNGVKDRASHAYNGRRTNRNDVMYGEGGCAYIYLCYGMHHLFNIVTNVKEVPHAVLIRALVPADGIKTMLKRRKQIKVTQTTAGGPGTLSEALGIKTSYNGILLSGKTIWVEDRGIDIAKKNIESSPRIGVQYAGKDALLPYRFRLKQELINICIHGIA